MFMVNSRPRKADSPSEGTDAGNYHHSRMAGQFTRADTLDNGRKHDHGLTKDHKESREHLARVRQNGEWTDATPVREKSASQPKRARRTKQTPTRPCSEEWHDRSCIVENGPYRGE